MHKDPPATIGRKFFWAIGATQNGHCTVIGVYIYLYVYAFIYTWPQKRKCKVDIISHMVNEANESGICGLL